MSTGEIMTWENSFEEGFHGILTRPDGEAGCLSKIQGSSSWIPLDKCSPDNAGKFLIAAQRLHNATQATDSTIAQIQAFANEVKKLQLNQVG